MYPGPVSLAETCDNDYVISDMLLKRVIHIALTHCYEQESFLLHFCCSFSVKLVNLEYLQIVIFDIFLLTFTLFCCHSY